MLDALVGEQRQRGRRARASASKLRAGELDEQARSRSRSPDSAGAACRSRCPGMPGASIGMINIGDMLGKAFGGPHQEAQDDRGASPTRC